VFIVYQLYVMIFAKWSWGLAALTAFDVVLVWLTWREYQARRSEPLTTADTDAYVAAEPSRQRRTGIGSSARPSGRSARPRSATRRGSAAASRLAAERVKLRLQLGDRLVQPAQVGLAGGSRLAQVNAITVLERCG
jgi:hypothetical protein